MEIIKSSAEITSLFAHGRRIHTSYLTLIVFQQRDRREYPNGRVAFVAGKKLGNAVWRNKAKRRMRAICFDLQEYLPNYDVVFLAKRKITEDSYEAVKRACKDALKRVDNN